MHEQRVAVGIGFYDKIRRERSAASGAIVHYYLLAPVVRHLQRDPASEEVGRAARCERNEEADGLGRVIL